MRQVSEKQCCALKAVTRRGLDLAGGGGIACHSTRVNEAQLSKYASNSEDNAKAFVPIDIAVELDMLAGSPVITSHMADLLGYRLVPVAPAGDGAGDTASDMLTLGDALDIANEASDVVRRITEALADGQVCAADRRGIAGEIDEAIRALKQALKKVAA